jgi:hypothetical protein
MTSGDHFLRRYLSLLTVAFRKSPGMASGLLLCIGCAPAISPYERLQTDNPLRADEVQVVDVTLAGEPLTGEPPKLVQAAGSTFEIQGRLNPGTRKLNGLATFWIPRGDESQTTTAVSDPSAPSGNLSVFIYGPKTEPNFGILYTGPAEVRQLLGDRPKNSLVSSEFRFSLTAPASGEYVIDLHWSEQPTERPPPGPLKKPSGFPCWRATLTVP